jgi:hypothetical protein
VKIDTGQERRRSARVVLTDPPPGTTVRLRAGHEAHLLNVSRHGILLESVTRLNPGQRCTLQWVGQHVPSSTSGVVTRAEVAGHDARSRLVYRAAIDFSQPRDDVWEAMTRVGNALLTSADVSRSPAGR